MSSTRLEYLQRELEDHPSLAGSIEDFETPFEERQSPMFDLPSQHSGFRSELDDSELETDSAGPWSPPAWRRPASGLFPHENLGSATHSPSKSRGESPVVAKTTRGGSADDTLAANVPLPGSPEKRTPSPSPAKSEIAEVKSEARDASPILEAPGQSDNYIRFSMRADVQHRTDAIDSAIWLLRHQYRRITKSKSSFLSFFSICVLVITILKGIFQAHDAGPGPDLIKVAGLAKSFEPLIYYSENGVQQIGELQETSVAVWDLSESVRSSNMTSAPIIVRELNDLSESVKTLGSELTSFFSNVDGDIDNIIIVFEWAMRELSQVSSREPTSLQSAYDNLHGYMAKVGGSRFGNVVTSLFGQTHHGLTKATLERTFVEALNVLEESVNSELVYSTRLFALFEAIDHQFLNLQRTVVRETDSQDAEEFRKNTELAELWRRMLGSNRSRIFKYEKNRELLSSIKDKTVRNKMILVDHNGKLLKLKSDLEMLRKRLVSPLVRSQNSSTLTIAEQIQGLGVTYEQLQTARERQKSNVMKRLYSAGHRRTANNGGMLDGR